MTMAWGLEGRVPFLDHELVELAAACPPRSSSRTAARACSRPRRGRCCPPRSSIARRATSRPRHPSPRGPIPRDRARRAHQPRRPRPRPASARTTSSDFFSHPTSAPTWASTSCGSSASSSSGFSGRRRTRRGLDVCEKGWCEARRAASNACIAGARAAAGGSAPLQPADSRGSRAPTVAEYDSKVADPLQSRHSLVGVPCASTTYGTSMAWMPRESKKPQVPSNRAFQSKLRTLDGQGVLGTKGPVRRMCSS